MAPIQIKLLSDLHTEFWPKEYFPEYLTDSSDILILAGDIAVGKLNVQTFLIKIAKFHKHVIYVPGNHEYYSHNIHNLELPMNVHYLNPGTIKINDVTFIGATLWTNFNNNIASEKVASKYIADFKSIKGFTTTNAIELYNHHSDFILKALRDIPGKRIVITHFLPSRKCIHPRWLKEDFPTKQLNNYFANNLDDLILAHQPSHWLFGHTHDSVATKLGDTVLCANPFGYLGHEVNPWFNEDLTIEI